MSSNFSSSVSWKWNQVLCMVLYRSWNKNQDSTRKRHSQKLSIWFWVPCSMLTFLARYILKNGFVVLKELHILILLLTKLDNSLKTSGLQHLPWSIFEGNIFQRDVLLICDHWFFLGTLVSCWFPWENEFLRCYSDDSI